MRPSSHFLFINLMRDKQFTVNYHTNSCVLQEVWKKEDQALNLHSILLLLLLLLLLLAPIAYILKTVMVNITLKFTGL